VTVFIDSYRFASGGVPTVTLAVASAASSGLGADGFTRGLAVSGNYAYGCTAPGGTGYLTTFDISDPDSIAHSANLNINSTANDPYGIAISGSSAFVVGSFSNKMARFDLTTPSAPSYVTGFTSSSFIDRPYTVVVVGSYAFVRATDDNAISSVDISSGLSADTKNVDATYFASYGGMAVIDSTHIIVTSTTGNSVSIVDVSDPAALSVVGSVTDASDLLRASAVIVDGDYAYVRSGRGFATPYGDYLTVIDISTPSSPTVAGSVHDSSVLGVALIGGLAKIGDVVYVSSSNDDRVTAVDVSNPATPTAVGSIQDSTDLASVNGLAVVDSTHLVAQRSGGMTTLEIS